MRYCKIKPNDVANGIGITVSLWTQGCPHHCKGCFNTETWDFSKGKEFTHEQVNEILELLDAYGVHRNLAILGGEPLCEENIYGVFSLLSVVKAERPNTKVYVWTGYKLEDLLSKYWKMEFKNIDVLIDGQFQQDKADMRLKLRGSSNQRIIDMKETIKQDKIVIKEL